MEEVRLARIAIPRVAFVMRNGEFVPMLRTAYDCAMLGPNADANPTLAVAL